MMIKINKQQSHQTFGVLASRSLPSPVTFDGDLLERRDRWRSTAAGLVLWGGHCQKLQGLEVGVTLGICVFNRLGTVKTRMVVRQLTMLEPYKRCTPGGQNICFRQKYVILHFFCNYNLTFFLFCPP